MGSLETRVRRVEDVFTGGRRKVTLEALVLAANGDRGAIAFLKSDPPDPDGLCDLITVPMHLRDDERPPREVQARLTAGLTELQRTWDEVEPDPFWTAQAASEPRSRSRV